MYKLIFLGVVFISYSCTSKTEHTKLTFLLKGNEAFEKDNLDKAVFYYTEAILTDSTYVDAYLNNALVLKLKGEYYSAIEMYDAVLSMNPINEDALFKRANLYLDVNQYYRALDDLSALDKTWQDSAILYFTKGLVNTKLKRYEVAISEFKHSLQLDKNQPQAFINTGNVFYYKGELDSASFYLKKGLELDDTEANGLNTLGLISTKRKGYNEAVNWFNKALTIDNQNAWYLNNKGFVFIKLEKFDSANYLINTSMKLDPYNPWVYRNKGLLELQKDNLPKAIKLLEKAYKMDKTIDSLALNLVDAYIKTSNQVKACELLATVEPTQTVSQLIAAYCE